MKRRAFLAGSEPQGPNPQPPAPSSWQSCYVTPIEVEAHVVKGFLEHYGVPCVIRHDRFSVHPLTFCAFGQVEILVPCDWAKVARGLIAGRSGPRRQARVQRLGLSAVAGRQHAQE